MSSTAIEPVKALPIKAAAYALDVSAQAVYRWVNDGKIGYIRIVGSLRIPIDEVKRVQANNRCKKLF